MEDFPLVTGTTDAFEATSLLVTRALPGLVVLDDAGLPLVVLPGSQVLRFLLPDYIAEDPGLAAVLPEADADRLGAGLAGRTVAELLPEEFGPTHQRDRPIVRPDATMMQIASVMSRQRSPIVAVVRDRRVAGVITVHRFLGAVLPQR